MRKRSPAEGEQRRSVEQSPPVQDAAARLVLDDDSRLAHVERALDMSTRALGQLGQQVARLEDTVHGVGEHRPGAATRLRPGSRRCNDADKRPGAAPLATAS